jgi:pimeloyl-ACP methyl ester carboxylesterase
MSSELPRTQVEATIWSATTGVAGAPHVVLVHGSLDRSAGLLKLSRRLDERFRVSRYDRRGYGRSNPHPGPFDMEHQVADLVEIIGRDSRAGSPTVIVGHSYGGNVALAAADRHPDLVAGVITFESPLSWTSWWPGDSAGANAMAWRDDPEQAAEQFMRRLIGDDRWDKLPPTSRAARRAEGPAMIGELTDLRSRAPWTAERITIPVIALHGGGGREHHRIGTRKLAEMLPNATWRTVPDAHHFGPNTHPEELAAIVIDFVERLTP